MLGQNHLCAQSSTVRAVAAFTNSVETVARSHHPGIGRRTFQIFAKVLEDRGRLGGHGRKIIEGLIHSCRKTCGGNVMPKDSAIYNLREEAGLWDQLAHQVRNVFLAL